MVFPSLASLLDLCSIRIAYLMWTRRDVVRNCWHKELLTELENVVSADIQSLPLPKRMKTRLLKYARPAGERLLSLLNLWLSQLLCETPQKWLLGYMLFDCLVLNADGLINQRKTAKTLLVSRVLHNTFAFRLACINFLENEVLKLWIHVKEYFLNKIILESQQHLQFLENFSNLIELLKVSTFPDSLVDSYEGRTTNPSSLTATTESEEVLFWISYCLSKENATDIKEVPHFKGNDVDWYRSLLQSAAISGNVACFDYFKNYCKTKSEYDPVDIIKRIFESGKEECQQPSFIFHYMLLNFEVKAKLFQEFPMNMVSHFLQWPLSQTFLENTEEVWNLIPNSKKELAFEEVSAILIHENILLNPFDNENRMNFTDMSTVAYCVEHISEIWIALWNKQSDSYKATFLELFVFVDFTYVDPDSDGYYDELPSKFETSGLKQKLLDLFLSSGEALLELYDGENPKKSFRSLVFKYMPDDFQDLDRNCISFLKTNVLQCFTLKKMPVKRIVPRVLKYPCNPVDENYLNYIKTILFSYRN